MKLSEILKDWPENRDCTCGLVYCECTHYVWNDALTSCDREIDREALAKILFQDDYGLDFYDEDIKESARDEYRIKADRFISTMPTWLKRSEDK